MIITQVWRDPQTIHYKFFISYKAQLPMHKEFYYHENWLPDPSNLIDPRLMMSDYSTGDLTKKELIQELMMLIIIYQEFKENGAWSERVFSSHMRYLHSLLDDVDISLEKLY